MKQKGRGGPREKIEPTPELLVEICNRIAEGRSLNSVGEDEDMPTSRLMWRWLYDNEEFIRLYTRAIQARAMAHGDRITELSRRVEAGLVPPDAARVAMDGLKWTAARLLPKIYGDKQEVSVEHKHTHTLHLEALKQLSEAGQRTIEAQVIDVSGNPTVDHKLLDPPAPIDASPSPAAAPRPVAGRGRKPPGPRKAGGGNSDGTPLPPRPKPPRRPHRKIQKSDPT